MRNFLANEIDISYRVYLSIDKESIILKIVHYNVDNDKNLIYILQIKLTLLISLENILNNFSHSMLFGFK